MRQLRQSFFFLIIGLVIFFNIERFDVVQDNLINIQTFVYILGSIAVLSTLTIPWLSRIRFSTNLAIWLGIYFLMRVFIFNNRPMLGGIDTYLSITEIASLSALSWLAYWVAQNFKEFIEAVNVVTLAGTDRSIPELKEATDLIHAEMNRVRRYDRPLSVIVAKMDTRTAQISLPRLIEEAQRMLAQRFFNAQLAGVVRKELRRMDLILGDYQNQRVIAICPEVNDAGTQQLIERISNAVGHDLGISVKCGAASFPDGALTFEELVMQAEDRALYQESGIAVGNPSPIEFSTITNPRSVDSK